jgi:hypothetical protein
MTAHPVVETLRQPHRKGKAGDCFFLLIDFEKGHFFCFVGDLFIS